MGVTYCCFRLVAAGRVRFKKFTFSTPGDVDFLLLISPRATCDKGEWITWENKGPQVASRELVWKNFVRWSFESGLCTVCWNRAILACFFFYNFTNYRFGTRRRVTAMSGWSNYSFVFNFLRAFLNFQDIGVCKKCVCVCVCVCKGHSPTQK